MSSAPGKDTLGEKIKRIGRFKRENVGRVSRKTRYLQKVPYAIKAVVRQGKHPECSFLFSIILNWTEAKGFMAPSSNDSHLAGKSPSAPASTWTGVTGLLELSSLMATRGRKGNKMKKQEAWLPKPRVEPKASCSPTEIPTPFLAARMPIT